MLLSDPMNLIDLTINQLKRAAEIKQQIEDLNKDLASILSGSTKAGVAANKARSMSASVRKKIAATAAAKTAGLPRRDIVGSSRLAEALNVRPRPVPIDAECS